MVIETSPDRMGKTLKAFREVAKVCRPGMVVLTNDPGLKEALKKAFPKMTIEITETRPRLGRHRRPIDFKNISEALRIGKKNYSEAARILTEWYGEKVLPGFVWGRIKEEADKKRLTQAEMVEKIMKGRFKKMAKNDESRYMTNAEIAESIKLAKELEVYAESHGYSCEMLANTVFSMTGQYISQLNDDKLREEAVQEIRYVAGLSKSQNHRFN